MAENKGFKYHITSSIKASDYDQEFTTNILPDGGGEQFEQKLAFELTNLDVSIVNGLRRVIIAEVENASVGPEILLEESDNITVFNTEMLKERISLLPIHLDSTENLEDLRKNNGNIIFRIADRDNWSQPIKNEKNEDRIITCRDILVLEKRPSPVVQDVVVDLAGAAAIPVMEKEDDVVEEVVEADPELSKSQADISAKADEDKYNLLDSKDFFKYQDAYLVVLKKGESLYMTMFPEIGTGLKNARWQSCVPVYKFKTKKEFDDPNYTWTQDEDYNPVKDIQNYQLSKNDALNKYRTPEIFQLSLEYNGHYRPSLSWLLAVKSLKSKMKMFLEESRLIDGTNGKVSEKLRVEFSPKDRIRNLVTLTVLDEDHTLGNIMSSHYLYNLEKLVKIINPDNSDEIILSGFSHYRVPYVLDPIENQMILDFKTPEWSDKQVIEGFDKLVQNLQAEGETVNSYDDDFYLKNPAVRLMMIVVERVINILNDLEKEAKEIPKIIG